MELTLLDRVLIGIILPKTSSRIDIIVGKDLKKKVSITQEEIVEYAIKEHGDGQIGWNTKGSFIDDECRNERTFAIELTTLESDLIKKSLEIKLKSDQVTEALLPLFEKFDVK